MTLPMPLCLLGTAGLELMPGLHCLQGRMTLLLGPPGSGKSAFLQVLAGRMRPSGFLRVQGDLRYNGVSPKEFNLARTAAYVHQFDAHIAGLTVKETLTFARSCQVPNDQSGEFNAFKELREVTSIPFSTPPPGPPPPPPPRPPS